MLCNTVDLIGFTKVSATFDMQQPSSKPNISFKIDLRGLQGLTTKQVGVSLSFWSAPSLFSPNPFEPKHHSTVCRWKLNTVLKAYGSKIKWDLNESLCHLFRLGQHAPDLRVWCNDAIRYILPGVAQGYTLDQGVLKNRGEEPSHTIIFTSQHGPECRLQE